MAPAGVGGRGRVFWGRGLRHTAFGKVVLVGGGAWGVFLDHSGDSERGRFFRFTLGVRGRSGEGGLFLGNGFGFRGWWL